MKQLLTYGLLLLTILASPLIMSACQDDLPETTEVMLTFTTRADLSFEDDEYATDSDLQDVDRMKDLRVIMLDGDNKVVGNAIKADINKSSVVFKFSTPASHGEVFKFLAIANEKSIGLENELNNIVNEQDFSNYETEWKKRVISSTLNPTVDNPLPQTKFWTWTYSVLGDGGEDLNPVLDYVGCKISVQFKNETNKAQSLSNIHIAGVGSGYLFKQDENDFVSDASPTNINLSPIDNLPATETSEVQHCYTYPKGNISSSPTLYATWNNVQYSLVLKDNQGNALTSLNRNDHLQIVVTLTGQELTVNYTIAPWNTDNATNIGSPTTGGGYNVDEWGDGNDVEIGGGDESGGDDGSGEYLWSIDNLSITPNYTNVVRQSFDDKGLNTLDEGLYLGFLYDVGSDRGRQLYIKEYNSTSNDANGALPSASDNVFSLEGKTEILLTEADVDAIKNNGGGVAFWGSTDVTITKIYLRAPTTQ